MQRLVALAVVAAFTTAWPLEAWADQKAILPAAEASAYKQMAMTIPLGSRIRVQTTSGHRLTATLMNVDEDGIVVKRETRVPEPALEIRFDEMSMLQRHQRTNGFGVGKAIGIGLAAGAGAILTLFAIAVSLGD